MKSLIIFDLDGTLAESKMPLEAEMAERLGQLLKRTKVAVISGASFKQFQTQFLTNLSGSSEQLANLFLMPTNGSSLYHQEDGEWRVLYEEKLSAEEIKKIKEAFDAALAELNLNDTQKLFGEQLEDRGSQVTFSGLGQEAPIDVKNAWDPDHRKRDAIRKILLDKIPEFEVRIGGTTSIDVTKKGIDKAYGIRKISEYLKIGLNQMLFIGDAVFPGGNDYAAKEAGVETVQVSGPAETIKVIESLIAPLVGIDGN